MAQAMKPLHLALLASALFCGAARAQEGGLPDPTRPPAAMSAPVAPAGEAASTGPQVQSILVSLRPGGRRIAVIDGKMLREGARVGDAVIESIHQTEVVLRKGKHKQVLKLFRPAARVAAA
jgi:MSHA biogenesis protein MshK